MLLRRGSGGAKRAPVGVAASAEAPGAVGASADGRAVTRAVFGLAGSKKAASASEKLEEALAAMRARVEQLELRAQEGRVEAARLAKAGQKTAALRALKKAKAVDAQVASNQAAVDAVEQQLDTLSQAAMQKTLASALASTSATMKKDAKALSKAETAIEDAQEARDMATDLNQVMAEFAQSGNGYEDEDELLAELNAMVAEQDAPAPPHGHGRRRADRGGRRARRARALGPSTPSTTRRTRCAPRCPRPPCGPRGRQAARSARSSRTMGRWRACVCRLRDDGDGVVTSAFVRLTYSTTLAHAPKHAPASRRAPPRAWPDPRPRDRGAARGPAPRPCAAEDSDPGVMALACVVASMWVW